MRVCTIVGRNVARVGISGAHMGLGFAGEKFTEFEKQEPSKFNLFGRWNVRT